MEDIRLTEEELEAKYLDFLNDPVKNDLLRQKFLILQKSVPKYVINNETKELTPIYEPKTAKMLEEIDKELNNHINSMYGDIATKIE